MVIETTQSRHYNKKKNAGICVGGSCRVKAEADSVFCVPCRAANRAKVRAAYIPKPRKQADPEKQGANYFYFWKILNKFNWTQEEYYHLLELQNNKCGNPSCSEKTGLPSGGRMHLDHDEVLFQAGFKHESVRAILCHACNTFLGKMGENPARIAGLALLLEQHIQRREEILNKERLVV